MVRGVGLSEKVCRGRVCEVTKVPFIGDLGMGCEIKNGSDGDFLRNSIKNYSL